jgi:hypothetical protein
MRWLNGEGRFGNFGLGLLVLGRVLGHVFISVFLSSPVLSRSPLALALFDRGC